MLMRTITVMDEIEEIPILRTGGRVWMPNSTTGWNGRAETNVIYLVRGKDLRERKCRSRNY